MINPVKFKPASKLVMDELGYSWDNCFDELVPVTEKEADAFAEATESLYSMYVEAANIAIKNNLFAKFGITNPKLIQVIKKEWEDEKFRHIWGRFDFAGGTSGKPIKLIEFNADTATAIIETSVLQYAVAVSNVIGDYQFNEVYESLISAFTTLKYEHPQGIAMVAFSLDTEEDNRTIQFLAEAASVAGIDVDIVPINELYFDREQGVFDSKNGLHVYRNYNVILKLVPWEMIIEQEPEYADIILDLILNDKLVVINPAYTLLFQSKYMLKFLYELYPDSKYLLKCQETLLEVKHVVKPIFGREGANVSIVENGNVVNSEGGDYDKQAVIYQEYVELDRDSQGRYYQAGSFMCNEACGVAFRRSSTPIIVNTSELVGHYLT